MKVYTGGTFDLFHEGHVSLLKNCKRLAGDGEVVVALNTDEFVEQFKGRRPAVSYAGRKEVLESCRYVSRVIPNTDGADSKPTILSVRPDVIAIGVDWAPPKDYYAQMNFTAQWLDENGILLVYLPRPVDGQSSTRIKAQVINGAAG
ncbi:adenylyltransferase/cytidyltransferase family protein [Catenuloplanes sp. NPDC051500]|uniref:adenylyltransferase/cytidyltransferase family protein n=1 Tax=Catenuloplanes sp. NPDC051500 TaxID=3363959 RepID=UPI003792E3BB